MNKVIIIGGPTGIGKSDLAVDLALRYSAAIVSADSMQIYKGMNIGTGKITKDEMREIPHYMLDIVQPDCEYSVQNYFSDTKKVIESILKNGKVPIIVGGTGLYINALINEQNFADAKPDVEIRKKYYNLNELYGAKYLHNMLRDVDKVSAEKISENDVKRIIRALEIYEQTGNKKSDSVTSVKSPYDIKLFVLQTDRQKLYERINMRVDRMFEKGLPEEVLALKRFWHCRSMQAIGYKEIIDCLQAEESIDGATELIKQNSRRYAKRQITFFNWIKADKIYVEDDFYNTIVKTTDRWLTEETK